MENVKVSVIIPIYNAEEYLEESLKSLLNQTMNNFEIICVNDGSTDNSLEILERYAAVDKRIQILSQPNQGAGAARNNGLLHASGYYCYFFDADDICISTMLEETVSAAEQEKADIVAFHFTRFSSEGKAEFRIGIHESWLPINTKVFHYKDCPNRIMSIINPTPWNKLFRTAFILEHGFRFEEIMSCNDITFSAVTAAAAERIVIIPKALIRYRVGHGNTITSNLSGRLKNIVTAVESAVYQVKCLPYSEQITDAIHYFAIDNFLYALHNYIIDFSAQDAQAYYCYLHDLFSSEEFCNVKREQLNNDIVFNRFSIVKQRDYSFICEQKEKKIIVSLTSYPRRIPVLHKVLETIYAQTRKPDEVVLWLAEDQFPEHEDNLSPELLEYQRRDLLKIRWCDDLKPHKKYFYTLQEYPEDLVITVDDDLLYAPTLLERLLEGYLLYPHAIIAARTHLITFSQEGGHILPYKYWIKETDACLYQPSMQLFATGGAGTLYPPHLMPKELFNKEAIMNTCLLADDLWMKAIESLHDIPVVLACPFAPLRYLPSSQEEALCKINVDQDKNDVQLTAIINWMDSKYEKDILIQKLVHSDIGESLIGTEALCECLFRERAHNRARVHEINRRLQQAFADKSEINRKLQITYKEKAERGIAIKKLEAQKKELENSLSYKVGCIILYFPKLFYSWFQKKLKK